MVEASDQAPANAPLLVWFQGGPGSSSIEVGLFFEHGPFMLSNGRVVDNPYSWHHLANVLYIDQPAGTGFSYTDAEQGYRQTLADVAEDIHTFFVQFFKRYPAYASLDLYLSGESYAGKYIPAISTRLARNPAIRLRGLAIADGWTHPTLHVQYYTDYAIMNGLIDENVKAQYDKIFDRCQALAAAGRWAEASDVCDNGFWTLRNVTGRINPYDIRTYVSYDFDDIDAYLSRNDTIAALYANHPFGSTGEHAGEALAEDEMQSVRGLLPALLERFRVLIFNGQFDFIVTCASTADLYWNLPWAGQDAFHSAPRIIWKGKNGQVAGYVKQAKNFTFVEVSAAGHMAPMDQPQNSFEMLTRFLYGKPW